MGFMLSSMMLGAEKFVEEGCMVDESTSEGDVRRQGKRGKKRGKAGGSMGNIAHHGGGPGVGIFEVQMEVCRVGKYCLRRRIDQRRPGSVVLLQLSF
jgi:hypothetical protein